MPSAIGNRDLTNSDGFTLVELLVVIAIAALLGVVVVKQSPGTRTRLEIQSAASVIVSDLTRARLTAISKGAVNHVEFDRVGRHYKSSLDGFSRALPSKMTLEGPHSLGARSTEGLNVSFFPDGTATAKRLVLTLEDKKMAIQVNWLTGRASVHD